MPPTAQLLSEYKLQKLPANPPPPPAQPPDAAADMAHLNRMADALGRLLQYRHQGFLPNRRQQHSAGLAAIEMAQAVQHLVYNTTPI